jgi:hypothetical protein
MPQAERIATFDQDGTLWVEHPMYTQVVYCLDRVPVVVKTKPFSFPLSLPSILPPFRALFAEELQSPLKQASHRQLHLLA